MSSRVPPALIALLAATLGCGRRNFNSDVPDAGDAGDGSACSSPTTEIWVRAYDWSDSGTAGTTAGNPAADARGRPVWFYEHTTGGALGEASPWYSQPPTLLVWDDVWFGSEALWARVDDTLPIVGQTALTHSAVTGNTLRAPRVRWQNPFAEVIELKIEGSLVITWSGTTDAQVTDVDVVVAIMDDAGNPATMVVSATVAKPTANNAIETKSVRIDPVTASVPIGGSLVVTLRARVSSGVNRWIELLDQLILSHVACP